MSFTRQDAGTKEEWAVIADATIVHQKSTPQVIMDMLRRMEDITTGFAADQLHHSLMTATLARRDNASDEEVLIALLHDIGKVISVPNHGPIAAEILRPYVSDNAYHAVYNHQHFQGQFYYHFFGGNKNMREKFRDEPWYALAEKFVDKWDNPAFDPDFSVDSLESFEPLIEQFFTNPQKPYAVGPIVP